jgi:hypothetical protein
MATSSSVAVIRDAPAKAAVVMGEQCRLRSTEDRRERPGGRFIWAGGV